MKISTIIVTKQATKIITKIIKYIENSVKI